MEKFNNAMAANKEWAAEYMNKCYKPGEGMPYNEKFGIRKRNMTRSRIRIGMKSVIFAGDTIMFTGELNNPPSTSFGSWEKGLL